MADEKDHSTWFYERAAFPLRDAVPDELEAAWHANTQVTQLAEWESVGPTNIAGRVTSLIVCRDNTQVLVAGSAGGGVWRSTNGGVDWHPCKWPRAASQSIGALAVHPKNQKIMFAATGEANLSPDTYPGSGFYSSEDHGESWNPYLASGDGGPLPAEARARIPRRVGTIQFDPHGTAHAAVGSVSLDERSQAGLYMFNGPGQLPIPARGLPNRPYNCFSIVYHPEVRDLMYVALDLRGTESGIWRRIPNGWMRVSLPGHPTGEKFGRCSIAISPSHPDIMYVLAANRRRELLGVFRGENVGDERKERWKQVLSGDAFPDERFLHYNNTIVVHPTKPDFVIWGGQALYRTEDGGRTWDKITSHRRAARNYVHEDHHALVMPDGDMVFSGNDGGVAVSFNGGKDWEERSNGMVTTMFYDVDVAATNSKIFGGGAQDAGMLIAGVPPTPGEAPRDQHFVKAFRGDGGWIAFDDADAEHVFGSAQNLEIYRHTKGKAWEGGWNEVSPTNIPQGEKGQRAIAVIAMEPGTKRRRKKAVWAGTHRLWRTRDDGQTWTPLPNVDKPFDGSVISAIEISPFDSNIIFVGTTKGGIFRTTDGGETWTENLAGFAIPRRLVTRIETHPTEPETVAVAVASTGLPGALLTPMVGHESHGRNPFRTPETDGRKTPLFEKSWSNVFLSENGGDSWLDIDGGLLPNVVFYALAFEAREPFRLFVAGDAGVWVKLDSGAPGVDELGRPWRDMPLGWLSITSNLPNVVVSDLVYHAADHLLFAATYGRGIWRLNVDTLDTQQYL